MSGEGEIDKMIASVKRMPAILKKAAPACADVLREEITRSISAGQSPEGEAWKPRADGSRALQNAAKALTVEAHGTVVQAVLTGPEAIHHRGTKKDPRRQILPTSGTLPDAVNEGFKRALAAEFKKAGRT